VAGNSVSKQLDGIIDEVRAQKDMPLITLIVMVFDDAVSVPAGMAKSSRIDSLQT
jgi:hypothetical protein